MKNGNYLKEEIISGKDNAPAIKTKEFYTSNLLRFYVIYMQ